MGLAMPTVIAPRKGSDPGKWQKEVFAPLPAIFLEGLPAVLFIRRVRGGVAGLLIKLSRMKMRPLCF